MSVLFYPAIKISDTTRIAVSRNRKMMEIITQDGDKQISQTVGPKEVKKLKDLLKVAGLPTQAVKAQIALKMALSNYGSWGKTEDKKLAELYYNLHNAMAAAYNELVEFNTKMQAENVAMLSKVGEKDN